MNMISRVCLMAGFEYIRCAVVRGNGCNDLCLHDGQTLSFQNKYRSTVFPIPIFRVTPHRFIPH